MRTGNQGWELRAARLLGRVQTLTPRWGLLIIVSMMGLAVVLMLTMCDLPIAGWPLHAVVWWLALSAAATGLLVGAANRERFEKVTFGCFRVLHTRRGEVEAIPAPASSWIADLKALLQVLDHVVGDDPEKRGICVVVKTPVFKRASLERLGFSVRPLSDLDRLANASAYRIHCAYWNVMARIKGQKPPRCYRRPWMRGTQQLGPLIDHMSRYLRGGAER